MQSGPVTLRPVEREDLPDIHSWESHAEWTLLSDRPYVPETLEQLRKAYDAGERWHPTDTAVPFAVQAEGRLVGTTTLWGIDLHNRRAHLGIGLGPDFRGRGYGGHAVRALLSYAFVDRGLHRVQLEVLVDNVAAIRAYEAAGFVQEGRTRGSAWVDGRFVDELWMSALSTEWQPG